jgi:PKD repeat protein
VKKAVAIILIVMLSIPAYGASRTRRTSKNSAASSKNMSYQNEVIFAVVPTADFTISGSVNGRAPQAITFTDASAGGATSWSWDFGDGQSSTDQSPTHTFTTGTAADVSLTATNDAGSNTKTTAGAVDLLDPYWYPTSLTLNESSGKVTMKNFVFSPTGGGTVYCRLYNEANSTQLGVDKSSSATPPTTTGITVGNGLTIRGEYWVTAAPAGYAAWGSSSSRLVLFSGWTVVDGRGDNSVNVEAHP